MTPGPRTGMEPLETLFDESRGEPLPLPPELAGLHGERAASRVA